MNYARAAERSCGRGARGRLDVAAPVQLGATRNAILALSEPRIFRLSRELVQLLGSIRCSPTVLPCEGKGIGLMDRLISRVESNWGLVGYLWDYGGMRWVVFSDGGLIEVRQVFR